MLIEPSRWGEYLAELSRQADGYDTAIEILNSAFEEPKKLLALVFLHFTVLNLRICGFLVFFFYNDDDDDAITPRQQ